MRWPEWIAASAIFGPLLLVVVHRLTWRSLRPDWAAAGIVAGSITTGGCMVCLIAFIAWPVFAQIPSVGRIGARLPGRVHALAWLPITASWLAAVIGVLLLVNLMRVVAGEVSRIRQARATLAALRPSVEVAVVVDDLPFAYALSSWRRDGSRILVSTGMVETVWASELAAVVAHERVHLDRRHAVYQLVADLATAINPLLRDARRNLDFALERWADEAAADETGRATIGAALRRSALASVALRAPEPVARSGWGVRAVPARLEALMVAPARKRWTIVGYALVCGVGMGAMVRALARTADLVDGLQKFR